MDLYFYVLEGKTIYIFALLDFASSRKTCHEVEKNFFCYDVKEFFFRDENPLKSFRVFSHLLQKINFSQDIRKVAELNCFEGQEGPKILLVLG